MLDHEREKFIDRDGTEARSAACRQHIGDLAARVLYHLEHPEAHHSFLVRRDEQAPELVLEHDADVRRIHEWMLFAHLGDEAFDGRPDVGQKTRWDVIDRHGQVRLIPR